MIVVEQLARVFADLLREDPRRVLVGEDVADGGMLGLSRAAVADPELSSQIVATPLTPVTRLAHAGGLALGGAKPVVLMPGAGELLDGLAGLREAAMVPSRLGARLPLLIVAPIGPGLGLGGHAAEAPEVVLARIRGLRVVVVGQPDEAAGLVRAAAEFWAGDQPTVVLLPSRLCFRELGETVSDLLARPFATPHVVRTGSVGTILTWGECVEVANEAVDATGIDFAVVDVECLAPIDTGRLVEAASLTGRIVLVHSGPAAHGFGAEISALLAEHAILYLDAPIRRVCGSDDPTHESQAVPSVRALAETLASMAHD